MSKSKLFTIPIVIGIFIILGFILLALGGFGLFKLAILSPEQNFIRQFSGQPIPTPSWDWIPDHPFPLDFSNVAIIGDYKIITSQSDRGKKLSEPFCTTNTCGGQPLKIDEDGCQIWKGTKSFSVNHDIGSTCGSTGCGKCNSGTYGVGGQVMSCSASPNGDAKEVSCTPSGSSVNCGGCLSIKSGGSSGSVTCSGSLSQQCGGQTQLTIKENRGVECWSKGEIFYKDQKIKDIDWDTSRRKGIHLLNGKEVSHLQEELHIAFHTDDQYIPSPGIKFVGPAGCHMIVNDYIFQLSPESFILNISAVNEQVFEGQLVQVIISIQNLYGKSIKGNLIVDFEVQTVIGSAKKREEMIIDIPVGNTDYLFNIPADQVTDKLLITPRVDFLMEGSEFQGANYICYRQTLSKDRALSTCDFVPIGKIEEKTFIINIIPKTGEEELIIEVEVKEPNFFIKFINRIIVFFKGLF